jgi:protein TonB
VSWPLRALTGSALVHGALVAIVLSMGSRSEVPPLFVDLTEEVPAREPDRAGGPWQPSLRAARAPQAPGSFRRGREQRPLALPEPAPTPPRERVPEHTVATGDPAPHVERGDEIDFGHAVESMPGASELTPGPEASETSGNGAGEADASASAPGPPSAPAAALAAGGSLGRSGADGAEAEYGAYLSKLRESILKGVRYPASARRRGVAGTVQIELTIRPSGAIGAVVVVGSSSHEVLDRAAVETIQSLRLPPFPPDLPARELRVRVPVVFRLE